MSGLDSGMCVHTYLITGRVGIGFVGTGRIAELDKEVAVASASVKLEHINVIGLQMIESLVI